MEIIIGAGIPTIVMLVMYIFGLFTRRNVGWVLLSLIWGAAGFGGFTLLVPKLLEMGLTHQAINIVISPLIQLGFVSMGVFIVIYLEKSDNLIDGAVYGIASGLGYAAYENIRTILLLLPEHDIELIVVQAVSVSLIYATASGIIGIAITQFYFRHRANRLILLLSGLGAGVGYTALFKILSTFEIGGDFLAAAFGIGGITLVGLYVTGLLRKILIQVGVEKKRADSLLEIVIPIGVELSTEEDFGRLLEKMLLEAKSFCNANSGSLYLIKDKQLEYAVVRNDMLDISMGGKSGKEISLPSLSLYDETTGEPNHNNIATYAALTGETVNIVDAYKDDEFDFSDTKDFDERTGYASVSFLTIPLKDSEGNILGVLELVNALNSRKKALIPFDNNLQQLMESFSSLASAALKGYIQEQSLRKEIQELRIVIDAVKRDQEVAEITNTDYFKNLKRKAKGLKDNQEEE
ncbi:MAG: GAF domain-containing protein [Anaerolineales bacterium]|uniref:GAF domain-containing protein n=1 Tax=Candidatus Desulfolinea nitratireducens TaxID=2841698 RepID=A0A8J6NH56_9CHLR|nr:GAF domain-containing protein [Candidatus Desulfolinea nitratireducens]MBL6959819.1 GAF domain-containing protein [Anaerolineales bacterium]